MEKPHKKLRAWQVGMVIVEDVYRITRSYPKEELFGLVSQMRRSAVSNPSNTCPVKYGEAVDLQVYLTG